MMMTSVVAVLVAVAQAIPMFFNNLLYNFFVNIPEAESLEVARINHRLSSDAEQIDKDNYRILRRGTRVRLCNKEQPLPEEVEPISTTNNYVDYNRLGVLEWLEGKDCNSI